MEPKVRDLGINYPMKLTSNKPITEQKILTDIPQYLSFIQ